MEGGGSVPELPETLDSAPLRPEDSVPPPRAGLAAVSSPACVGLSWQPALRLGAPSHLLIRDGHKQVLDAV